MVLLSNFLIFMKTSVKMVILYVLVFFIMGNSCNKQTTADRNYKFGISSKILNIVDSVFLKNQDDPFNGFMTIEFYSNNDTNYVSFINAIPVENDGSSLKTWSAFLGYKPYKSNLLVFVNQNGNFESLIRKDSLIYDDVPKTNSRNIVREVSRQIYWINENDSLIFIKEEDI